MRRGRKDKKLFLLLFTVLFCLIFFGSVFSASGGASTDLQGLGGGYVKETGLMNADLRDILVRWIQIFLGFLSIIGVIIVIYGGFVWMTSGGSPEKIGKAKRILRDAVIGLIIVLSAFAIVTFFIRIAGNGGGGESVVTPPTPLPGGAALGSGIVESHYPGRGQTGVPRNTNIAITFKERIVPGTVHVGGLINSDVIKIMTREDYLANGLPGASPLTDVQVTATADGRTFTFNPDRYLGSAIQVMDYTVFITNGLQKYDANNNSVNAFPGGIYDHYEWSFQVSTELDLVPPRVTAVFPPAGAVDIPRNAVIALEFSEPIDPTTISGTNIVDASYVPTANSFNILTVAFDQVDPPPSAPSNPPQDTGHIAGEWQVSNNYSNTEFLSFSYCGSNSCGDRIYCLMAVSEITVLALAAPLISCASDDDCYDPDYNSCTANVCQSSAGINYPQAAMGANNYEGIVDMAGNSLDGNADGRASGPPADNYSFAFNTSANILSSSPVILERIPGPNGDLNGLTAPVQVLFDRSMMTSTFKPDTGGDGLHYVTLCQGGSCQPLPGTDPGTGYWITSNSEPPSGTCVTSYPPCTRMYVSHGGLELPPQRYSLNLTSNIKDRYQNCLSNCTAFNQPCTLP